MSSRRGSPARRRSAAPTTPGTASRCAATGTGTPTSRRRRRGTSWSSPTGAASPTCTASSTRAGTTTGSAPGTSRPHPGRRLAPDLDQPHRGRARLPHPRATVGHVPGDVRPRGLRRRAARHDQGRRLGGAPDRDADRPGGRARRPRRAAGGRADHPAVGDHPPQARQPGLPRARRAAVPYVPPGHLVRDHARTTCTPGSPSTSSPRPRACRSSTSRAASVRRRAPPCTSSPAPRVDRARRRLRADHHPLPRSPRPAASPTRAT